MYINIYICIYVTRYIYHPTSSDVLINFASCSKNLIGVKLFGFYLVGMPKPTITVQDSVTKAIAQPLNENNLNVCT